MSSAILTLLVSHILTYVENELAKEEPQLVADVVAEIQLLISKLEAFVAGKSPAVAAAVNPVLAGVASVAVAAVQAAGDAAVANVS